MNKIITAITLLSICLLSSCSMFKGKSDAPTKKGKTEKVSKKTDLPPSDLVSDPSSIAETSSATEDTEKVKEQGRIIEGFIEPDVTGLPDNKDLQESVNVAPIPEPLTPKEEVPQDSLLTDPNTPLPEVPKE